MQDLKKRPAMINPVKAPVLRRSYTNPNSQGTLITQTKNWPGAGSRIGSCVDSYGNCVTRVVGKPESVPEGLKLGSDYVDRMWERDKSGWDKFTETMGGLTGQHMGLSELAISATDEMLTKAMSEYAGREVVAVRWVYFYNVSTGYDSQRIDFLYRPLEE
ncbi:MAG: hypothetical protein CMK32_09635 [Porticoccaceae bacterium]|nr:hypothetical protein [Porticoccaceae bacterium]